MEYTLEKKKVGLGRCVHMVLFSSIITSILAYELIICTENYFPSCNLETNKLSLSINHYYVFMFECMHALSLLQIYVVVFLATVVGILTALYMYNICSNIKGCLSHHQLSY